jgi:hypothetical protein
MPTSKYGRGMTINLLLYIVEVSLADLPVIVIDCMGISKQEGTPKHYAKKVQKTLVLLGYDPQPSNYRGADTDADHPVICFPG